MQKNLSSGRIHWLDFARVLACFVVVLAHSCDFYVAAMETSPVDFFSGSAWGTLTRACVPLFVMFSGVLLLPTEQPAPVFYRKRLSKIVFPLIFWSLVTPFFYYFYGMFSLDQAFRYVVTFPFGFNLATIPLWYLYMLVGLYLFIPVISPWIRSASKKDLELFLKIWGISLFVPYLQLLAPAAGYEGNYGNMGILGVCDWNAIGMFYYTSGFLGYLVLGYYMNKYPFHWSVPKTLSIGIPLFLLGYAITFCGFISVEKNYPALEVIWYFTNINVFLMTFAAFAMLQKVRIRNERANAWLKRTAILSFGIYLVHFFFVQCVHDWVCQWNIAPYFQIPMIAVLAFSVSYAIAWLLSKLPKSRYLIG